MSHQTVEDNVHEFKMVKAESKAYARLMTLFQTPINDIAEAFKALIFTEDNEQQLVDGATDQIVKIDDVLRTEKVFVLVSGLYITQREISLAKEAMCEACEKYEQYPTLWIPIADKWDIESKSNFDKRRPNVPANWYIAKYVSSPTSTRFIKNEWYTEIQDPTLLLINEGVEVLKTFVGRILDARLKTKGNFVCNCVCPIRRRKGSAGRIPSAWSPDTSRSSGKDKPLASDLKLKNENNPRSTDGQETKKLWFKWSLWKCIRN